MPILEVKALPQKNPEKISNALKKTCKEIAEFYQCDLSKVWATWQELKPGFYIEGEEAPHEQPESTHPPLVTLTCFEGLSPEKIEYLLELTSKTLTKELSLGENMFILYKEAKSGEVVSGNGVVRSS